MRAVTLLAALLLAAGFAPAAPAPGADVDPRLDADLETSDARERSVVVHFRPGADRAATLAAAGVERALLFERLPRLAAAWAPPAALRALAASPDVARLEADARQELHLDTAAVASRVAEVRAGPAPLDGTGVGVAVVDSGVDATHRDLPHGSKVKLNLKFVGEAVVYVGGAPVGLWQDVPDSDTSSGHGTHVAGIVGGLGERYRGAAPGATIYGLGAGEALLVAHALAAFDWILANHAAVDPPIRVVSNSWGGPGAHDPDSAIAQAVDAMVDAGLVVVFSAGNDGGDGGTVRTNVWGNNPKPGVVMVANYDDGDSGARDRDVVGSSSRGDRDDPATWPDVAAPGTRIASARAAGANLLVPVGFLNGEPTDAGTLADGYVVATGTSMAAPHVAGLVALLLQADPALTPGEVERLLERTATPFGGDVGPDGHFARGHGLIDAVAAVAALSDPAERGALDEEPSAPPANGTAAPPTRATPAANGTRGDDGGSLNLTAGARVDDAPAETPLAPLLALAALALAARRRR